MVGVELRQRETQLIVSGRGRAEAPQLCGRHVVGSILRYEVGEHELGIGTIRHLCNSVAKSGLGRVDVFIQQQHLGQPIAMPKIRRLGRDDALKFLHGLRVLIGGKI